METVYTSDRKAERALRVAEGTQVLAKAGNSLPPHPGLEVNRKETQNQDHPGGAISGRC